MHAADSRAVVQGIYTSAATRDAEKFAALVHPDIEVHQPDWLPYGGSYYGTDELMRMFGEIVKFFDLSGIRVTEMVAEDEDVWATFTVPMTTGRSVSISEHWRVRDGKAVWLEVWHQDPRPLLGG